MNRSRFTKKNTKPRHNEFSPATRFIYLDDNYWECWNPECGTNNADCLHHIFGRGKEEGCESSALNAAPLCNQKCHLPRHGFWTSDSGKRLLLTKTIGFLSSRGYVLEKKDEEFLEKYGFEIYKLGIKI